MSFPANVIFIPYNALIKGEIKIITNAVTTQAGPWHMDGIVVHKL